MGVNPPVDPPTLVGWQCNFVAWEGSLDPPTPPYENPIACPTFPSPPWPYDLPLRPRPTIRRRIAANADSRRVQTHSVTGFITPPAQFK